MSIYAQHIASQISLPELSIDNYNIDGKSILVTKYWRTTVQYDQEKLLVAVVESDVRRFDEGLHKQHPTVIQGLLGKVYSDTKIESIVSNLSDVNIPAHEAMSNMNIYDSIGSYTDVINLSYFLTIETPKSRLIVKGSANNGSASQKKLGHALIQTAHLIAEKSGDAKALSWMRNIPNFEID